MLLQVRIQLVRVYIGSNFPVLSADLWRLFWVGHESVMVQVVGELKRFSRLNGSGIRTAEVIELASGYCKPGHKHQIQQLMISRDRPTPDFCMTTLTSPYNPVSNIVVMHLYLSSAYENHKDHDDDM